MSRNELQEEWERRIALFKASGMSQKKWCQVHHVSIHQLKYWLYNANKPKRVQDTNPKFIPVTVEEELPTYENNTIQVKVGEAVIEVKPDFNPDLLAKVIKVLKTTC